jgi:hypothetical protein
MGGWVDPNTAMALTSACCFINSTDYIVSNAFSWYCVIYAVIVNNEFKTNTKVSSCGLFEGTGIV